MRKIIGIGETVLDIIFRNDSPTAAVPGGSTFNAMISLGRTAGPRFPEVPILMVTETGSDHVGDLVCSFMESNGVCTKAVTRNQGTQTHVSLAFLDENNNAQYEFYKDHASAKLDGSKVADIEFAEGDLVLFGSFFAINPKIRDYVKGLLSAARNAGATIYYDINFRKNHIAELPEILPLIIENCRLSDFVRGSDEDFGYLFGTTDPSEVYEKHIAPLCSNFICTCGPKPVHVFSPGLHETFPTLPVETVSTIGAGDNFNAGFIYALLASGLRNSTNPDKELWKRLTDTAGRFSAHVCQSIFNYVDPSFNPEG